ncbi:MAG TPA: MFS transporter, partial [Armatimonadota bacterium]|nr:MFS transporter [Armatimonadota bacterium]
MESTYSTQENAAEPALHRGARVAFWLLVGYVGIYLCRKNLSVALPMLQTELGASKAAVGVIASWSTFGYMLGKFVSGPVIDRVGGRNGFLLSMI